MTARFDGTQPARLSTYPPDELQLGSDGRDMCDLMEAAGVPLLYWQRFSLTKAMGRRPDGRFSAFEAAWIVGRQNGKSAIAEARMFGAGFILQQDLTIYTSHLFSSALEIYHRMREVVDANSWMSREVKKMPDAHGDECIQFMDGRRIKFGVRNSRTGRGYSCDCLVLDEAMALGAPTVGAILPTMSARPNPQVFYFGSAGDKKQWDSSQLAMLRRRIIKGDRSLAGFEWSVDEDAPYDRHDPLVQLRANPSLGVLIAREQMGRNARGMPAEAFDLEFLGIGDWPEPQEEWSIIPFELWSSLGRAVGLADAKIESKRAFAVEVAPDRMSAAICAAGPTAAGDGSILVDVVERKAGTEWVVPRLVELCQKWRPVAIGVGVDGPSVSVANELERPDVKRKLKRARLVKIGSADQAAACGQFFDAVVHEGSLRHLNQPWLVSALSNAAQRPVGDGAWKWDRKNSRVDIGPLVAATEAVFAYREWVGKRVKLAVAQL